VLRDARRRARPGDRDMADVSGRTGSVDRDPVLLVGLDGVPAEVDMADLADGVTSSLDPYATLAAVQRIGPGLLDGGAGQRERGAAADEDVVQAVVADAGRPVT